MSIMRLIGPFAPKEILHCHINLAKAEENFKASLMMKERPLSPHLQIYKPLFTMMMSIFHRVTGVALYFGVVLIVLALVLMATNKAAYAMVIAFEQMWLGKLGLICFTWALFHHMLGGLRHFLWDTGKGFGIEARERLAQLTLAGSVILTALVWICGAMR
jgi:succinate dehydrogenase / fumarate reductase cytochrome b subunit